MAPWRRASSSSAAAAASSEPARPLAAGNARVSPEISSAEEEGGEADEGRWSGLVPELLTDILRRVHAGAERWPRRRDVVACACVCRRWRDASVALVRPPLDSGGITFLSSLKQPGPRDAPIQCFIKRNKENSVFYLYLNVTQALTDQGKFMLAARRIKCGLHIEYIIYICSDDLSHGNHVGKLKSDLMRTNFTIYDLQPRLEGAKVPNSRSSRWTVSKKISPRISTSDVEIGEVSYEYNLLKSRGPRRIQCSIQYPAHEADVMRPCPPSFSVLINRRLRWHEHLQCWCLNFNGRVMVASVKNFQLISPMRLGGPLRDQDDETVILQFGKIEENVFTMDYRQPLSAFQAFAICLTSFGSKLAWE